MNKATRSLMGLTFAALAPAACGAQADVLTSTGQMQKSDGTWTVWCAETESPDPTSALEAFIAQAKQGLTCTAEQGGGCGKAIDYPWCGWDERSCAGGHVMAATTTTLGCAVSPPQTPTNTWSDCASALANGSTGDACSSWQPGACLRTTDDPCCIEVARCSDSSLGTVRRSRICAPGCTGITADTSLPPVSSCADLPSTIDHQYAVPCTSSFACVRTGSSTFADISTVVPYEPLYFCADGKIWFLVALD